MTTSLSPQAAATAALLAAAVQLTQWTVVQRSTLTPMISAGASSSAARRPAPAEAASDATRRRLAQTIFPLSPRRHLRRQLQERFRLHSPVQRHVLQLAHLPWLQDARPVCRLVHRLVLRVLYEQDGHEHQARHVLHMKRGLGVHRQWQLQRVLQEYSVHSQEAAGC